MGYRYARLAGIALIVAGCTSPPVPREPIPITPQADVKGAPVVRRPMEETPAPNAAVPATPAASAAAPPAPAPTLPSSNILYTCATDVAGQRKQTAIEFTGKVGELCRKHPEMGPCQYEREVCRRAGGRVFAADGSEITAATEAEYDKRVLRVRFRAN
ncbi:MAG: hypothetical protein ABJC33_09125 [Betaproteobacteria bacterium]